MVDSNNKQNSHKESRNSHKESRNSNPRNSSKSNSQIKHLQLENSNIHTLTEIFTMEIFWMVVDMVKETALIE